MKWLILVLVILTGCSSGREAVMPFKNYLITGDRLFPIKLNASEFTFRIWINNSTSVDRVITISEDSVDGFQGTIIEYGNLYRGNKSKNHYSKINITPKSGFKEFKNKLDELQLFGIKTPEKELEISLHQGFSTYVVEIKNGSDFNSFKFDTYFPSKRESDEKFDKIESLIFGEFGLKNYFKMKN